MSLLAVLDRLSEVSTFDKSLESARTAVNKVLRPGAFKDLLHGTWLGHPLHPIIAMVPVGTCLSAGVLDLVPATRPAATALISTGVAASLPAAVAGLARDVDEVGAAAIALLAASTDWTAPST